MSVSSSQQVRPLAAAALQSAREGGRVTLDYFSLDPGEDWGQVTGATTDNLAQFAAASVARLLELVPGAGASVVLVGVGRGGQLARLAAMSAPAPASVQLIVDIATAAAPGLVMDRETEQLRARLEAAWSEPRAAGTRHVTLVSVTDTAAAPPPHHAAADVSARVPRGTGGLWCRDMVARINTALVSTVSGVTKQVRGNIMEYNCNHYFR